MRGPGVSIVIASAFMATPAFSNFQPDPALSPKPMAPVAKAYLDEAITLFRKWHINAAKADWPSIAAKAYAAASGANKTSDTYPAIQLIIKELGEKHTMFVDPDAARAEATGAASGATAPPPLLLMETAKLANGVGLVRLFSFQGSDHMAKQYVDYGRTRIAGLRAQGVCRFILDLRQNGGGNMYPMLSAVNAFLDDGILGSFEYVEASRKTYWGLKDGEGVETAAPIPVSAARRGEAIPVAVLLGPRNASSGEMTAMSFKGRSNTRFFGWPTGGYVTSNETLKLSDGAQILMTAAWSSDRTGKKYFDVVEPDENTGYGGPTMDAANEWLLRQPCKAER